MNEQEEGNMQRYKCTICGNIERTPYDHGVHSNEQHGEYKEPEVIVIRKAIKPKRSSAFLCGRTVE